MITAEVLFPKLQMVTVISKKYTFYLSDNSVTAQKLLFSLLALS